MTDREIGSSVPDIRSRLAYAIFLAKPRPSRLTGGAPMADLSTSLTVRQIKALPRDGGDTFSSVLLVKRVSAKTAKNGNPFLTVDLSDKTGKLRPERFWRQSRLRTLHVAQGRRHRPRRGAPRLFPGTALAETAARGGHRARAALQFPAPRQPGRDRAGRRRCVVDRVPATHRHHRPTPSCERRSSHSSDEIGEQFRVAPAGRRHAPRLPPRPARAHRPHGPRRPRPAAALSGKSTPTSRSPGSWSTTPAK